MKHVTVSRTACNSRSEEPDRYLELLKLSDVGVTLQLQVSHLVFMFLMLMEPLVLLPLLFLGCKLDNRDTVRLPIL